MIINKSLILTILVVSLTGCNSYKKDFDDCPIPIGQKCKSLYEIHQMADQGEFAPNNPAQLAVCSKNCAFKRGGK